MPRNRVLVVGSANMDLVVTVRRFPRPGETIFGGGFGMFPGGKGANQAVASAKLGVPTTFLGKMGDDIFRQNLRASMKRDGVDLSAVLVDPKEPTGTALITVDRRGENEIVVISGSNMKLRPADLDRRRSLFRSARVVLLQLEIPVPTVARAAALGRQAGAAVILNPAPARKLPSSMLRSVDILTPNETEAELLSGVRVRDERSAAAAAKRLLSLGVGVVIVTLGSRGCLLVTEETVSHFPARKVKPVDTTAAGDAFNGALAAGLAGGKHLSEAIVFAGAVAAFSVTRMGAQTSMPSSSELRAFLR
jgi:ribokinase